MEIGSSSKIFLRLPILFRGNAKVLTMTSNPHKSWGVWLSWLEFCPMQQKVVDSILRYANVQVMGSIR